MTAQPDALRRLIRDYMDQTGDNYEDIARRGSTPDDPLSSRTVQALATRERSGKGLPRPGTLAKLAKGMSMSEAVVRAAAGYSDDARVLDVERSQLRMLVAVSAELDEERLDALLRRGRHLLDEQREEAEHRHNGT